MGGPFCTGFAIWKVYQEVEGSVPSLYTLQLDSRTDKLQTDTRKETKMALINKDKRIESVNLSFDTHTRT